MTHPRIPVIVALCLGLSSQVAFAAGGIVINEIQVGGADKATDEFVELYNPFDQAVDLTGWRLSKKTASGSLSNLLTTFPSVSIPSHGFLLITHQDYTGVAPSDLIYSTQSSLTPDNTVILYSDNGQTVADMVGMGSAGESEGRAAASPEPGASIARSSAGADTDNNATDFSISATPTPKEGTQISQGTGNPAGEPSAPNGAGSDQHSSSDGALSTPSAPSLNTIYINELLPNPIGSDEEGEWIELANSGDREIDLADWAVEDASGKHYTIARGGDIGTTTIAPHGYFVISRAASGIALNNTGEEKVILLTPDERTIDSIIYSGPAREGHAWAQTHTGSSTWTTTPTRSASNVITAPLPDQAAEISSPEQTHPPLDDTEPTAPSSSPATTAAKTVTPTAPPSLVINELLPNPEGDDAENEWIELKNIGDDDASTEGLTLTDISGTSYPFTDDASSLAPHGFLLLPRSRTKIVLNNDADTITLAFRGIPISSVSYEDSKEGYASTRAEDGTYTWTATPTPHAENTIRLTPPASPADTKDEQSDEDDTPITPAASHMTAPLPPSLTGTKNTAKNAAGSTAGEAAIDALRGLARGAKVTVTGTVVVPPQLFGKTQMYLNGIQLYSVSYPYPELQIGDIVTVFGTLSASGGETRITVPKSGSITRIDTEDPPLPRPLAAENIDDTYEGMLVALEGEIVEAKGDTVWLDDGTGEVRIVLKEGIGATGRDLALGARYAVIGVLSETASGYRLLPRGPEDINPIGEVLGESTTDEPSFRAGMPFYYVITAITVILISAGLGIQKWRMHRQMAAPFEKDDNDIMQK